MKYEKNVKELENIVAKLSDEKLNLEESIELYSKGLLLAKDSIAELDALKAKIELLNKDLSKLELEIDEEDDV
ncbi:exodeoxyribonuclease VII small subunit [bacterium]|nr:exodeoxyribonuclease VII small subunit [bacterium]